MKKLLIIVIVTFTLGIASGSSSQVPWGDMLKGAQKALGLNKGLSIETIIKGLKEALEIGTKNAVENVSHLDGYYKNPTIKIPLPGIIQKVEKALRFAGYDQQLDAFDLSMNRAAEKAAPEARSIFWDAIKQMQFSDAQKILDGRENEATLYFKEKTSDRLHDLFKPIIGKSMGMVGATAKFQQLDEKVQALPFGEKLHFDLDNYVTQKALDGLFVIVANEEKLIRNDPTARVTPLLKQIFGNK